MCLLSEVMGMTQNGADIFSEAAWEGHKSPDECPGICMVENGNASDCKMSQELVTGSCHKKKKAQKDEQVPQGRAATPLTSGPTEIFVGN